MVTVTVDKGKMAKTEELMVGESQFKEELRNAEFALEQQHQARRLDLILGTGNKIQVLIITSSS